MRIFKLLLAILLATSTFATAKNEIVYPNDSSTLSTFQRQAVFFARPVFLRSDALTKENYLKLRNLAKQGVAKSGIKYDWRGFPKFKSNFNVQLKPSQFNSNYYGKICNKQLLAKINKNPVLRRQFTDKDMELLRWKKNPQGKVWHHDPSHKGRMQLVDKEAHQQATHVGGNKTWGQIKEKTFLRETAKRWGSVAVLDIALSSAVLLHTGELDLDHLGQLSARSAAGATTGFAIESLLVKLFPAWIGMPPGWVGGISILYGANPAAWVATFSAIAARTLVDKCWENHRLHQLQIQEQACRIAESKARWQRIESKALLNTEAISGLLADQANINKGLK